MSAPQPQQTVQLSKSSSTTEEKKPQQGVQSNVPEVKSSLFAVQQSEVDITPTSNVPALVYEYSPFDPNTGQSATVQSDTRFTLCGLVLPTAASVRFVYNAYNPTTLQSTCTESNSYYKPLGTLPYLLPQGMGIAPEQKQTSTISPPISPDGTPEQKSLTLAQQQQQGQQVTQQLQVVQQQQQVQSQSQQIQQQPKIFSAPTSNFEHKHPPSPPSSVAIQSQGQGQGQQPQTSQQLLFQ